MNSSFNRFKTFSTSDIAQRTIERIFRRDSVGRFEIESRFGTFPIEARDARLTTPFLSEFFVAIVGHEVFHARQQKCAKAASRWTSMG